METRERRCPLTLHLQVMCQITREWADRWGSYCDSELGVSTRVESGGNWQGTTDDLRNINEYITFKDRPKKPDVSLEV